MPGGIMRDALDQFDQQVQATMDVANRIQSQAIGDARLRRSVRLSPEQPFKHAIRTSGITPRESPCLRLLSLGDDPEHYDVATVVRAGRRIRSVAAVELILRPDLDLRPDGIEHAERGTI